jgi:hypothetical protein
VQDKMHLQFSNLIRGVDQYVLPGGKSTVTLPSGYSHVWVSNLGEYTLSNNANFNPNQQQQFKGSWTLVKTAPR